MIDMFSSTYQAELGKSESTGVVKAIQEAMNRHPLGENINFRTAQYNRSVYQLDEKLWKYTKLTESEDPTDYLYSQRSFEANDPKSKFVAIASNTSELVIGVCEFIVGPTRTVEFDLSLMRVRGSNIADEPIEQPENEEEVKKKETKCILTLNCAEGKLELWLDGVNRHSLRMKGEKWEEYKFFVCLKEKGSWMRVHRQEMYKDN